jgi:hypothetical protein
MNSQVLGTALIGRTVEDIADYNRDDIERRPANGEFSQRPPREAATGSQ